MEGFEKMVFAHLGQKVMFQYHKFHLQCIRQFR